MLKRIGENIGKIKKWWKKVLNKRNAPKQTEIVVMLAVFGIAAIYVWGWIDIKMNGSPRTPRELLPLLRGYAFQNSLQEMLISIVLLWKAHRFNACIFTKIATWLFVTMAGIGLFYVKWGYLISYKFLIDTAYIILFSGIASMLVAFLIYRIRIYLIKRKYKKLRDKEIENLKNELNKYNEKE